MVSSMFLWISALASVGTSEWLRRFGRCLVIAVVLILVTLSSAGVRLIVDVTMLAALFLERLGRVTISGMRKPLLQMRPFPRCRLRELVTLLRLEAKTMIASLVRFDVMRVLRMMLTSWLMLCT